MPMIKMQLDPPSCTGSVLPQTMALAKLFSPIIARPLRNFPTSWPFEDQVLAWLCYTLRSDVEKFHAKKGPALKDMFKDHILENFDRDFTETLYDKAKRLDPNAVNRLLKSVIPLIKNSD